MGDSANALYPPGEEEPLGVRKSSRVRGRKGRKKSQVESGGDVVGQSIRTYYCVARSVSKYKDARHERYLHGRLIAGCLHFLARLSGVFGSKRASVAAKTRYLSRTAGTYLQVPQREPAAIPGRSSRGSSIKLSFRPSQELGSSVAVHPPFTTRRQCTSFFPNSTFFSAC